MEDMGDHGDNVPQRGTMGDDWDQMTRGDQG